MAHRLTCFLLLAMSFLTVLGCKPSPEALRTSLVKAVRDDNLEEVKRLIREGADANSRDPYDGFSVLAYAARNGNVAIVQTLLNAGADPNSTVTTGGITRTPLVIAEASLEMAKAIPPSRVDEVMSSSNDPALLRSMKDPHSVDRYQQVVDMLSKVTKSPWN